MLSVGENELCDRSDIASPDAKASQSTQPKNYAAESKLALEKSKKANEFRNNLSFGKKVAKLPLIESVED